MKPKKHYLHRMLFARKFRAAYQEKFGANNWQRLSFPRELDFGFPMLGLVYACWDWFFKTVGFIIEYGVNGPGC